MSNLKKSKIIKKLFLFLSHEGAYQYIASTILENIGNLPTISTEFIANYSSVAQSTVSKFIKKLGYDSFASFKNDLIDYQKQITKRKNSNKQKSYAILENIVDFSQKLLTVDLSFLINLIKSSDKIIINATGGAHRASKEFFIALKRINYFIELPSDFMTRYALAAKTNRRSLIICITNSGQTWETLLPTKVSLKNQAQIILITANKKLMNNQKNVHKFLLTDYLEQQDIDFLLFSQMVSLLLSQIASLI